MRCTSWSTIGYKTPWTLLQTIKPLAYLHLITKHAFKAFRGKTHCDDALCDVREIQVESILSEPLFLLRHDGSGGHVALPTRDRLPEGQARECRLCRLLDGEISEAECQSRVIRATRDYAKRQLTWCRNQFTFPEVNLTAKTTQRDSLQAALTAFGACTLC